MQPSRPGEASAYRGGIGRSWPDRKWLTLAVVALGTLMTALDASIVNISLPSIAHTFHTPLGGAIEWVVIAYLVVIAATLLTFGRLSDLVWRRRLPPAADLWAGIAGPRRRADLRSGLRNHHRHVLRGRPRSRPGAPRGRVRHRHESWADARWTDHRASELALDLLLERASEGSRPRRVSACAAVIGQPRTRGARSA